MSDAIKHECGIALLRLLKPLEYYKEKYGYPPTWKSNTKLEKLYFQFRDWLWHFKVEPMGIITCVIVGILLGCFAAMPMESIETSRRKDTCTEAANLIRTRFIESGCADKMTSIRL